MSDYFVKWELVRLEMTGADSFGDFFALSDNGNIRFIGKTGQKKIPEDIFKTISLLRLPVDTEVWSGYVVKNLHNNVTSSLIEEILCLLVHAAQPGLNTVHPNLFYGRKNLVVYNRGCDYFDSEIFVKQPVAKVSLPSLSTVPRAAV